VSSVDIAKIKTAFILGAGRGMRLRPLTERRPKPLLPVGSRPLITFAMDHCLTVGIERFVVNTHHCPAAYDEAFPEKSWRGTPILFRHEPVLLDTAGGLKNIEDLLTEDETILIYNGDILSDLPLGRLIAAHMEGGREVTLALRSEGPLRNVALDADGAVCDLRGLLGNPGVRLCLFAGIYAVKRSFFRRLVRDKVESVVPVFAEMIRELPGSVDSVVIDEGGWQDIGDPEAYDRVKTSGPRLCYSRGEGEPQAAADRSGGGLDREARAFIRTVLGLSADVDIPLIPVGWGGSDRDYFRIAIDRRDSVIFMRYRRLREENGFYAEIAGFLRETGVSVPAILGHAPDRGLLAMEDLGAEDLFSFRDAPWDLRRPLYEKTLEVVLKLHAFPPERFPAAGVRSMPGFGPELYRWERDYFREHCVMKACGVRLTKKEEEALERELELLARRLLETPPVLVHRDLQSQNVMIRRGEPFLIDFQGMRFGSHFYDLGSLLYDPYVDIPEEEREILLRYYFDRSRLSSGWNEFETLFRLASAQRLMQALGAFGFLGLERGKPHFLAHIPPALDRLIDIAGRTGALPRLHALARRCRASIGTWEG
jgi:aminoglycoside/choline kinase family phosphotransferase/dTDP-glucose pyrophosphorylase